MVLFFNRKKILKGKITIKKRLSSFIARHAAAAINRELLNIRKSAFSALIKR